MLAEILASEYSEPIAAPVFGPEGGEAAGPRSAFNDVDDFHGWNKSPPQYRDGTVMPDRVNWRHRVQVSYAQPNNPALDTAGNSDQGAKQIRVTIEYGNKILAEQFAVRTNTDE